MNGFLADTNVISEYSRQNPNPNVRLWFQKTDSKLLYARVITFGELRLGIEDLPIGKRRSDLDLWFNTGLPNWFSTNLLPITETIAYEWARLTIQAKRKGIRWQWRMA